MRSALASAAFWVLRALAAVETWACVTSSMAYAGFCVHKGFDTAGLRLLLFKYIYSTIAALIYPRLRYPDDWKLITFA